MRSWRGLTLLLLLAAAPSLLAQAPERETTLMLQGAYYFGYQEGYGVHDGFAPISYEVVPKEELSHPIGPGRDLGYSWGQAGLRVAIEHSMKWPFLVGAGPLLEGNNLKVTAAVALSPISITASTEAVMTPVAVAEIAAGASAGTGWAIPGLANGLGRNLPDLTSGTSLEEPFSGLVISGWLSATLQFDFEALWPGEWHHIVVAAGPKLEYWDFTAAGPDTAWQWEADEGEDFNGWRLSTSAFAGYRMPLRVRTAGLLVETTQALGANRRRSTIASGGWGSDFVKVTITPLASVTISERASLTALVQLQTAQDYTDATIGERYFELRKADGWYIYLERLVAALSLKL